MPFGTPLARFIYDIGGGGANGRDIKAVQTGGPSGGCIPADMLDTPVDYESLAELGSIMGSGGMVVIDEDNCMVDVARYFMSLRSASCGKCAPCRVGLDKALRILNRCTQGKATHEELALLDELCRMVRDTSLCALGGSAPNPVLTTMRHFRHEFEDHIVAKRCRAGVCEDLALSPCENSCPLHMNIPRFLQLYKEGRLEDAFLSVIFDNPLPASTGRVCQHPCDDRCRRSAVDEAVNMRDVHRLIADQVLLSDKFDTMVARVLERRSSRPGARSRSSAPAGPTGLAGLLPGAPRPQRDRLRLASRRRRHAALRPAGVPAAEGRARQGDRADRAPGRDVPVQRQCRREFPVPFRGAGLSGMPALSRRAFRCPSI